MLSETRKTELTFGMMNFKIAFLKVPNVSSSVYREQGDEMTIAPPIKDYIYQHKLYQWQKATTEKI